MNGDEIRFLNLCAELMVSLGLWVTVTEELQALASRPVCELYKDGTFLSPLDPPNHLWDRCVSLHFSDEEKTNPRD